MTREEMIAAAAEFDAMPCYAQWELPKDRQSLCEVWVLAAKLARGFREYPALEIPTDAEIETLYAADLNTARAAVDALNAKYRSGWSHSAQIAGVAARLGIRR